VCEPAKSYDRLGALRFPLLPHHRETAWRYLFDWAIAGEALNCVPGDLVLEFASGPGYASEFLNRLGYDTVAIDLNPEILAFAQERLTLDQRLDPAWASFLAGDGQRLPFADSTFEGVICLNALHHMPDYAAALGEIRRILRAGGRAVFSEPGSLHADSPEARHAIEQYSAVEKSIVLDEICSIAHQVGFERMILKPYVYPCFVDLDYQSLDTYRLNLSWQPYTRPDQVACFLEQTHAIFVLTVPGDRPVTSLRPNLLHAEIALSKLPTRIGLDQQLKLYAKIRNTGDTLWFGAPRRSGGHVTFGARLYLPDGQLLSDALGRTALPHDVPPGEQIEVQASFRLPETVGPGDYVLRFDMVDEQIAWFEEFGSPVVECRFSITNSYAGFTQEPITTKLQEQRMHPPNQAPPRRGNRRIPPEQATASIEEVAEVLRQLRQEVRRRGREQDNAIQSAAQRAGERFWLAALERVHATARVNPHLPIAWPTWPSRMWSKVVALTQKAVRRSLRWYINPIVEQQNRFNLAVTHTLDMFWRELDQLKAQLPHDPPLSTSPPDAERPTGREGE
jgi:ubiquinone/menaquinone biosynthesis C-methylase UbiE